MRKDNEIVRVGYASNGLRAHIYHALQNIYQKEPGVRFELQEMTSQRMRNGQPEREGSEDPEMEMPGLQSGA